MKKALYRERYLMVLDRYESSNPKVFNEILEHTTIKIMSDLGSASHYKDMLDANEAFLFANLTRKEFDLVTAEDYRKLDDPWAAK